MEEKMWVLEEWTGNWSTIYLAANNENMLSENGPLRMNFCLLTSHPMVTLESPFIEGLIVHVKASASLQKKPVAIWFSMLYSWKDYLYTLPDCRKVCIIFLVNISEDGFMTSLTMALAKGHGLSPEDYEVFKEKKRKWLFKSKISLKSVTQIPAPMTRISDSSPVLMSLSVFPCVKSANCFLHLEDNTSTSWINTLSASPTWRQMCLYFPPCPVPSLSPMKLRSIDLTFFPSSVPDLFLDLGFLNLYVSLNTVI